MKKIVKVEINPATETLCRTHHHEKGCDYRDYDKNHFCILFMYRRLKSRLGSVYRCPQCLAAEIDMDQLVTKCNRLESAIRETLADNAHLADGEDCTLAKLKQALTE